MRYAKVLIATGRVVNIEEWDGNTAKWSPPADCTMIASATACIGDHWDGASFTPDTSPPPPDPLAGAKAEVRALMAARQGDPNTPIDDFLAAANGSASNAQRDFVIKQIIRSFRALIKIARSELDS